MAKQKAVSKTVRFEVFKRDKFTCQYCGKSAPSVILHLDHIKPRASGGDNDILNLVTSCAECNSGKSDKPLDDDSAVEKQRRQLEELEERKQQLSMMVDWQRELMHLDKDVCADVADIWHEYTGVSLNEEGHKQLASLIRKFGISEVCQAIKVAADQYVVKDIASSDKAFSKLGGIIVCTRREKDNPGEGELYRLRGILRHRLSYVNEAMVMTLLREAKKARVSSESLETFCRSCKNWTNFRSEIERVATASDATG